jgi:hypothetical protein
MTSLSPSDQETIIRLCERHEEAHRLEAYYHRCVELGSWFIKYNGHGTLESEYKTHEYLYNKAFGDSNAPRIPRIVAYFSPKQQWAYLVTERIDPMTPADVAPEAVAKALQWLRGVPAPQGLTLGPVGGGRARHELFKDFRAPLPFSSVKALQNYMNRVCLCSCPFLVNRQPLISPEPGTPRGLARKPASGDEFSRRPAYLHPVRHEQ